MQVHRDHHDALDFEISAELAIRAMSGAEKDGSVSESSQEQLHKDFHISAPSGSNVTRTRPIRSEIMSPTGILDALMDRIKSNRANALSLAND